jgi:uncharacterized damage-inducible protein DinB
MRARDPVSRMKIWRAILSSLLVGARNTPPLGDLMQHAAVHAVHHRGQVALLLRALGYVPGNFDWLLYLGEKRSVPG